MTKKLCGFFLVAFVVAGCQEPTSSPTADKEAVKESKADGFDSCSYYGQTSGCDLCDAFGWYGDGECDQHLIDAGLCLGPDPDCGEQELECPPDAAPNVEYHSCFTTDIWTCPQGWDQVIDPQGCGCFCIDNRPVEECPEEGAPNVEYHSCFTADIWTCTEGWDQVIEPDGCGCFCIDNRPVEECPEESAPNVEYHSCFTADIWTCTGGWDQVIEPDGCGCYCIDRDPQGSCPSEDAVEYHSCFTADFWTCLEGWDQVIDPEGCGCYCQP